MVSKEEALAFMMPHKQKPLAATRGGVHFRINSTLEMN